MVAFIAIIGGMVATGFSPAREQGEANTPQQSDPPVAQLFIAQQTPTSEPTLPATATETPTHALTVTPSPTATATVTAVATLFVPAPTQTATPGVNEPEPSATPNGVRYGDHNPDLPGRIVRIASSDIKLDTGVYEVYTTKKGIWEVADYAAGHHFNSKNPGEGGNIILSGHNNWRGEVFRYLEFLKPGDIITVWTQEGKRYSYRVEEIKKLKEAGMSMPQRLENGKMMDPTPSEQLTLITCWPYTTFTHRLIVIAKPVN